YDGSSPQTASGMNSYINYTRSYSYAAIKCLTDPYGPMNEGALRPITVKAPEGSFLNPRPPAGGGPRAIIRYRTFEAVIGALARVRVRRRHLVPAIRGRRLRRPARARAGARARRRARRLRVDRGGAPGLRRRDRRRGHGPSRGRAGDRGPPPVDEAMIGFTR